MTLGENLCKTYALTSFRRGGCSLALLAINEALEAAALIADQEQTSTVANRIRALKWAGEKKTPNEAQTGAAPSALRA
jgi:hypothetical protein